MCLLKKLKRTVTPYHRFCRYFPDSGVRYCDRICNGGGTDELCDNYDLANDCRDRDPAARERVNVAKIFSGASRACGQSS